MKDGTPAPQRKHAAAAAFQFLSRFPVKMHIDFVPPLLRESVVFIRWSVLQSVCVSGSREP